MVREGWRMSSTRRASVFGMLSAVLLTLATSQATTATLAVPGGSKVLALSPPVRAALLHAHIKVLFPAVVPLSLEGVGIAAPPATAKAYSLDVVADPECVRAENVGTACTQATVEGKRPAGPTPAGYRPVKLSDDSTGYYHEGPCGANCAGSFELTFVRWNNRYTIGIKAGTLAQGLAIERGLRLLR